MREVHQDLFVGDQNDYEFTVAHLLGWAVVHACKLPYHKQAVGYSSQAAPRGHPEYLVARRGARIMLNIVDTDNPAFFSKEGLIDPALNFLDEQRSKELKILIHCNQGESRAPSIALLYMAARLGVLPTDSLEAAEVRFRPLYPNYFPKPGIRGHLRQYWQQYGADGKRGEKADAPDVSEVGVTASEEEETS